MSHYAAGAVFFKQFPCGRFSGPRHKREGRRGLFVRGYLHKVVNLEVRQRSEFADAEATVGDFADAGAFERYDGQSDTGENSADLVVEAFGNCHSNQRALRSAV